MYRLVIGGAAAMFVIANPAIAQVAPPPGVAQGTSMAPMRESPPMRTMRRSDRVISREEVIRHVDRLFAMIDANHDGFVTKDEVEAFHRKMMMRMERHCKMQGHGARPPHEMQMHEMHMRGEGMGMGFARRLFEMADTNHDGRVTLKEAEAAALAHFDRMDLNHDGRMTPEEREQARALMHGRKTN